MPVPDALAIARWADGVVFATRLDITRLKLVDQATALFHSAGIPILGAVVHGVVPTSLSGGYSSSYRNGRADSSVVSSS